MSVAVKSVYRCLPSRLTAEARGEAARLGAQPCSVEYVPMVGFLLVLPPVFDCEQFEELIAVYLSS